MSSWDEVAHRQQHTPALPDRSAAAQETNDHQHSTHTDEHIANAGQLG